MTTLTNFTSLFDCVNVLTSGWIVNSLYVTFFVVCWMATLQYGKWRATTYAAFVSGLLLAALNFGTYVPWYIEVLAVGIFMIGVSMMISTKEGVS
jgi:hypothetical protein